MLCNSLLNWLIQHPPPPLPRFTHSQHRIWALGEPLISCTSIAVRIGGGGGDESLFSLCSCLTPHIYKLYTLPLDSPATLAQQLAAVQIAARCSPSAKRGRKGCISQMNNHHHHHATFTLRNRVLFVLHSSPMSIPLLLLPPSPTGLSAKWPPFLSSASAALRSSDSPLTLQPHILRCVYCLHRQVLYASLFY